LDLLKWLVAKVAAEYRTGEPQKRVLILEEAYQFVPERAGVGFNAPGRNEAYECGLLMMQIREYGLRAILISQRTAVVAKSALLQCENVIAFKSADQTGLNYLEALMGNEVRAVLPRSKQEQAVVFGPAISLDSPAVIDVLASGTITMTEQATESEPSYN
jgi:DNA helicase HerA-like ATPase